MLVLCFYAKADHDQGAQYVFMSFTRRDGWFPIGIVLGIDERSVVSYSSILENHSRSSRLITATASPKAIHGIKNKSVNVSNNKATVESR